MLRDGAARLQPALLLALAHDRRLAAKRPEAEEAATILAHILDVGFAAADSIKVAGVKIAIEGESAIVSIDTSPTARSSPAKQHATQPARSSPLAG